MQSRYICRLACSTMLAALAAPVFAQSGASVAPATGTQAGDDPIETIDVTGLRQTLSEAQETLDRRAGGTSLVDAETFENGRSATLSDVLAFAPGVLAQTRHGEDTRLSIRGSGIQRGFQLRGVQLYQDGVPLNLADGGGDFQSIDPLAIQYVEIWRGANALEYGSSALGGAINFVTPTGHTAPPAAVRFDTGSFGQSRGNVRLAGVSGGIDGFAAVTIGKQDGWRTQSGTQSSRLSGNVGYRLGDTVQARIYLNYVDTELDMPGALSLAQLETDPEQAAPNYAERGASNNYTMGRVALTAGWTPQDGVELVASVYHSQRDRFHPTIFGILDQDATNTGLDVRGALDYGDGGAERRLVFGASGVRYRGDEDRYATLDGVRGAYRGRTELDGRTYVAYAEYSHGLGPAVVLQLGAQITHAERKLDNLASPADSYDETFDGFSPKIGLLYSLSSADQLFANVSRSFEPAPFGEARVLPDLPLPDAQEATTFEAGWRRRAGALSLEVTGYVSTIDNEFLALIDENGVSLGTANADATLHRGLEAGLRMPLSATVELEASYAWSDFTFDDDIAFGDNTLAGVPPHSLNARIHWEVSPWLTVAPMLEWRGGTTWIDHANTVGDDGYALIHLGLSGALTHGGEWFVDVRNLADEDYVSTTLVRDNVNGGDSASYFPGEPRSVFGGLRWSY